jgi:hypothetical protein
MNHQLRSASGALASVLALTIAGAALADRSDDLSRLEALCRAEGDSTPTCQCLKMFVDRNFTEREIKGAAILLTEGGNDLDIPKGIALLQGRGYGLEEILSVSFKIANLEDQAVKQCRNEAQSEAAAPNMGE